MQFGSMPAVMYRARGGCAENELLYKGTLGKITGK
jgi:hypothetical protein